MNVIVEGPFSFICLFSHSKIYAYIVVMLTSRVGHGKEDFVHRLFNVA